MFLNSEVFSHQRGKTTIGYRKIKKGMLVLSAQNLHLGNANVNMRFDSGLVSPAYKVYNIVGCLPQFLAQWVKRDSTKQFFLKATTQGASECRKNVVWDQLYQQTIAIPSIPEQGKIAECISALDETIAAEADKLEALKNHKKGLMQQLFPQPAK
jgi:type I restriction enzyme S subunit